MEATHLKEVETGATKKADIVSGIKEKLLEEDFAGNYSNWQEVSVMTGYKKSVLESQTSSEVKTSKGSPKGK